MGHPVVHHGDRRSLQSEPHAAIQTGSKGPSGSSRRFGAVDSDSDEPHYSAAQRRSSSGRPPIARCGTSEYLGVLHASSGSQALHLVLHLRCNAQLRVELARCVQCLLTATSALVIAAFVSTRTKLRVVRPLVDSTTARTSILLSGCRQQLLPRRAPRLRRCNVPVGVHVSLATPVTRHLAAGARRGARCDLMQDGSISHEDLWGSIEHAKPVLAGVGATRPGLRTA
mmetsp:Transcript_117102/g.372901  ORF Transcript_117102/g.372901 Transcript_117102/m.372901 type:complete len:227 (-) Transcript_117102:190-870(-)